MTREQFARAVRAEPKWIENTVRLLGRRPAYGLDDARRLGLVR